MSQPDWVSSAAFVNLPMVAHAAGVTLTERDGLGLASVRVKKNRQAELTKRVRERFGVELPDGPSRRAAGDVAFIGIGPGAWLAICDRAANAFAPTLVDALGDLAAITDQTDGYAVLRVSGPNVRTALCKLVPVDLHPRAFVVGAAASTLAAHMSVILWRLDDGLGHSSNDGGGPVFEIAVFRSCADSFQSAVSHSVKSAGQSEDAHLP